MTKTPEQMAEEWATEATRQYIEPYDTWSAEEYAHVYYGFLAGYQAAQPQWISVKDRLPENGIEVLVVSDGETGASWHEKGEFGWAIGGTVTHWMPLPEPPEEEK